MSPLRSSDLRALLALLRRVYAHRDLTGFQEEIASIVASLATGERSEHDREVRALLRPHLAQAYENALAVSRLARDRERVACALDDGRHAVVLTSASGVVRFASGEARTWLERYFGSSRRRGRRLPGALRGWLHDRLAPSAGQARLASPVDPLVVRRAHGSLVVRATQDGPGDDVVLVLEERRASGDTLGELGLSPRETEVLFWVAQGKTNGEIGTILGISARTVQKHVEAIFRELGVGTRAAATRIALETVQGAGD